MARARAQRMDGRAAIGTEVRNWDESVPFASPSSQPPTPGAGRWTTPSNEGATPVHHHTSATADWKEQFIHSNEQCSQLDEQCSQLN